MHPALMILPVALFMPVARGRPPARAMAIWLGLIGLAVAAALGARVAHMALGAETCGKCRDLVPFAALAEQLEAAGFQGGTIVVPPDEFHIGGNLRVAFPASRVVDPAYPLAVWPPPGQGQCLAVWRPDVARDRAAIDTFLQGPLGVPADTSWREGRIEAPLPGAPERRFALAYALAMSDAGDCR